MIITFEEWLKENPKYIPKGYGEDSAIIPYRDLPPIVLSPIVYELWKEKYEIIMSNLGEFLEAIQGGSGRFRSNIQSELKERGVITKSVGSGRTDKRLYRFFYLQPDREYEQIVINDYLIENIAGFSAGVKLKIDHGLRVTYALYWNSWWFAPGLFVFNIDLGKYPFINWLDENPLEGK